MEVLGWGGRGFVLPLVPVLFQPLGNLPVAVLVRSQGGLHHQVGRPLGLDVRVDGAVAVGMSVTVLASANVNWFDGISVITALGPARISLKSANILFRVPGKQNQGTQLTEVKALRPRARSNFAASLFPISQQAENKGLSTTTIAHDRSKEFHWKFNLPVAAKMIQL